MNNDLITEYLNSLNDFEKQALEIAKEQLESSFCLEKSIGFLEFKKKFNDGGLHSLEKIN